jgi:Tuberculosis necrotizing toxin/Hemagglutinin repeat
VIKVRLLVFALLAWGSAAAAGVKVTVSVGTSQSSNSSGNSNEQSTTSAFTQIGAGTGAGTTGTQSPNSTPSSTPNSTLTITSGGNTTMTGAVASASQVSADIKGNLAITSVQDSYSYQDNSKTTGASLSGGTGANGFTPTGGSITAGKSNTSATYQAVTEQSGIKTGDAGFNITVGGQTTLTGAVIASTDKAVNTTVTDKDGKPQSLNQFQSAGGGVASVSATDLVNTSAYTATSSAITAGVGSALSSSGAGVGNAKGNETSVTQSGISGINVSNSATGNADNKGTVNNTVRTTDTPTPVLANTFKDNKDAIKANVNAQVQITQQFGQAASKAIGDLGDKKLAEAKALKEQAAKAQTDGDPAKAQALTAQANDIESNWKEGGTLRVLAHTLTGALTGNLSGAAGAATSQTLVPMLGEQLKDSALPLELKQGLLQIAAIAIGTAAGGGNVAGAAAAQNATANNYLKHTEINKLVASNKACSNGDKQACAEGKALNALDEKRQQALSDCQGKNTPECNGVRSDAADAMQGLTLYKEEIKKLVANGEMSANAAQTYLNKADTEIKDVAYHLKDDYYVKSGGVADPKSPDYIKYKVLESMTNGQELGGALAGAPTAGPSEKMMGRVVESNPAKTGGVDASASFNNRMTADQDLPNVYNNQQQRNVTKTQDEIDALQRIGDNSRNDTSNLNNNINLRGEIDKERAAASAAGFVKPDGTTWYPPNRGSIPGTEGISTIPQGSLLDRYGSNFGTFVAPAGTPFEKRALPYDLPQTPPNSFTVDKPIDGAKTSNAIPWFDQPGTGKQIELPKSVNDLLKDGSLKGKP